MSTIAQGHALGEEQHNNTNAQFYSVMLTDLYSLVF